MNINQPTQSQTSLPSWRRDIHIYDGLEISPVHNVFPADSDEKCYEVCEPEQAEIWSVYGHLCEGGVECFEDFETASEARSFAASLLVEYPHLSEHGIFG